MSIFWPLPASTEKNKYKIFCRLKEVRYKQKLTQLTIASYVGITREYVSMIERGVKYPSLKVTLKLLQYLKIERVNQLFLMSKSNPQQQIDEDRRQFEQEILLMLKQAQPQVPWEESLHQSNKRDD